MWRRAAEEIPPEERPAFHLVPSLDVFASVENVLQLKQFVYMWVRIRPRWLLKVGEELQPPDFSTRRAWWMFMRGSFNPTPAKPESEAGKSQLCFSAYLALPEPPLFDISKTSLRLGAPGPLDRTVSAEVVATVLHQVNQLNFFPLGARGHLTGGYMLITLWFFKQFVHTFPRGDMLITF